MAQPKALLDTDILSIVMKRNPLALARTCDYLAEHGAFTLSRGMAGGPFDPDALDLEAVNRALQALR
jgi:hypothetical protein